MAVQYPTYQNTLTKGDLGIPDYAEALNKGLSLYQNAYKSKYTPRNLENEAIKAEQYNQERKPYAENANRAFEAEVGGKEGLLKKLLFDMAQKKREYEQKQFLDNLISGGNASPQSDDNSMPDLSGSTPSRSGQRVNPPGHMTPHGFEGSLTGIPAENYYSNTGPDLQAEKEAIDRIDRANAAKDNMPYSSIPAAPNLAQNISQGMQQTTQPNVEVLFPGNPNLARIDEAWEKFPQIRSQLEKDYKMTKTQEQKYDPKSGVTILTTKYPSGKLTRQIIGATGEQKNNGATNTVKTAYQSSKTANAAREYLANNVKNPYGGNLSSTSMAFDLLKANLGSKSAQKRIIDAIVFSKTIPENAIFQLQSQSAKPTVHAIEAQKSALMVGLPAIQDFINNHVPQKLLNKANNKYNKVIEGIKDVQQKTYEKGFTSENPSTSSKSNKKITPTPEEARAELARRRALRGQ